MTSTSAELLSMPRAAELADSKTSSWSAKLAQVVETARQMSRQTDPQAMVRTYTERLRQLLAFDRILSLSRRDLPPPRYRITRSSTWTKEVNPWKNFDSLPVFEGGLLGELLYQAEPRVLTDFTIAEEDPAAEYLAGQQSLMAIPLFEQGTVVNMVVLSHTMPAAFHPEQLPELVSLSNLFGRATHHLVVSNQLRAENNRVDGELKLVADIQRSLLPAELPRVPTLDLATHYQTASRAGGDYFDLLELPEGKWGILIADVSGHGTPAAVLMAVTHALVHTYCGPPLAPSDMLEYLNRELANRYVAQSDAFVTAFYGVYDPTRRELCYSCAGHNAPRLKRCADDSLVFLDQAAGLPLGVFADHAYEAHTQPLMPGDQIIFYTDGITEAANPQGELFGTARLDEVLEGCADEAHELLRAILWTVDHFTAGRAADDDRTIIVARIS